MRSGGQTTTPGKDGSAERIRRIDNLLLIILRRDFECLEELADFVLDRFVVILERPAVFGGKWGMGLALTRLGQDRLNTTLSLNREVWVACVI